MGVVNVTPDSFSDGGQFADADSAAAHGLRLREEGADIIDVGGESTRPGAQAVAVGEELRRTIPVVEKLAAAGVAVSIDTMKPQIMRAAVAAGASLLNDVNAFREKDAVAVAAESDCGLIAMHMQGEPRTMQKNPHYDDVVLEVRDFLESRADALLQAGIPRERIAIDPGFGFGKTLPHNISLMDGLTQIAELGLPIVVGVSRKSMLGQLSGHEIGGRIYAGIGLAVLAATKGATIIRTHDVLATRDALAAAFPQAKN